MEAILHINSSNQGFSCLTQISAILRINSLNQGFNC